MRITVKDVLGWLSRGMTEEAYLMDSCQEGRVTPACLKIRFQADADIDPDIRKSGPV
jgi:hypothetical protein